MPRCVAHRTVIRPGAQLEAGIRIVTHGVDLAERPVCGGTSRTHRPIVGPDRSGRKGQDESKLDSGGSRTVTAVRCLALWAAQKSNSLILRLTREPRARPRYPLSSKQIRCFREMYPPHRREQDEGEEQMTAALSVSIAVTFIWLGMVVAISFLEAPLKFRAPGVTVPLVLGIGPG